jgi:hypothetical protein
MSRESLLSEFIDAWTSGQRPDVDAYLNRADEGERGSLEREIHTFLRHAPTPAYSAEARAAIGAEPLTHAISEMPSALGLWGTLLPSLRKRARLPRDRLVAQLAEALGASGQERKVARYYHQMEAGTLDPNGVSARVLGALASLLGVPARELEDAGSFHGFAPAGPQPAFGRTHEGAPGDLRAMPAMSAPPEDAAWDEVDRLFRGGR